VIDAGIFGVTDPHAHLTEFRRRLAAEFETPK
jgi:hypothetical protein